MTEPAILEGFRLGATESRDDPRTLRAAAYMDPSVIAPAPPSGKWSPFVTTGWPMFLNDSIGDCVIAWMGHTEQLWGAAGTGALLTDQDVLKTYEAITGYSPADPSTDQGTSPLDALNYWLKTGIAGHKIAAFVQADVHNRALLKDAIWYLAGIGGAVQLPISAQRMGNHWRKPSTLTGANAPGSWGGHMIYAVDYNRYGVTVVSWGQLIRVDWAFWNAYFIEAWIPLSHEQIRPGGMDAHGFNFAALTDDLTQIGHFPGV